MHLAFKHILVALFLIGVISSSVSSQESKANWYERKTTWNGFSQYHFQVAGRAAYIVAPAVPKKDKPWIWRARFPGYHAEMDLELVKRGFHLGYVDVAGLFGSPTAIEIGKAFYQFATEQQGLSSQVCLEGVSRGGLLVYNWAAKNTNKVAAIYCDTPVCDFKSWPAGLYSGIGSKSAWQNCLNAYKFTAEEAEKFLGNPIDHAQTIAAAKIPLLHIVSENDRVVPPSENTYLLKQRIEDHGHQLEIISVTEGTSKSNGHHFTHPDPQRVIDFFLSCLREGNTPQQEDAAAESDKSAPSTAPQQARSTTSTESGVLGKDRPNVIVIMTDDQGYGDLSCHGDPLLQTPNLDRLHSESIRFTDFHVSPFCTPTRAALMTGRYPARTGAYRTSSGRTSIHPREKTLGHLFNHNGYSTGMFGKWHLGDCAPSRPMDCGFDKSVWHRCGGLTQISDYWTNDYFDDTYLVGDRWKPFKGYCTDVWFDQTMNFIQQSLDDAGGEKPFFAYLATNAPHGPYLVADKWKQPFIEAGLPKTQAAFKGMVANFDWNLGRLLQFLKKEQLEDNTILIFLTDNGTSAGTVYGPGGRITGWPVDGRENAGMRGGKSSAYDGGHRVPLFIRHSKLGEPRDIESLSAHMDITPTLMQLCDLKRPTDWPPLDGQSLIPAIKAGAPFDSERVLHSQMHGGNGYVKPGDPWEIGVAMTKRWRLVEGRELYDIQADPSQRTNVAQQFPRIFERLNAAHLSWFESLQENMHPTRIHLGSAAENPTDLTSQEWVMPVGGPPWAKSHVQRRLMKHGSWWVDIRKSGRYRFELSRWPIYIARALDSVSAGISVGGVELSKRVSPEQTVATFEATLPQGPTELTAWLETAEGKKHGAYFVRVTKLPDSDSQASIIWTQYGLSNGILKIAAHTSMNPLQPSDLSLGLEIKRKGQWSRLASEKVDPLTAMAVFRIENWPLTQDVEYRVSTIDSGPSEVWRGTIRANPLNKPTLKLMAVACVNDTYFPYREAVAQMIEQDPDLIFFAGDQIYESNSGGEVILPQSEPEVAAGMANYLAKWRKFGLTFRELLKDRPSIIITDDHDVYANDLWGNGGMRMQGDRTTGGYPTHPAWVNAAEATQTAHLPDAVSPGPWGDGINAYFTALDYGGVSFAILEDRKFKSPPSEVLQKAVEDPLDSRPNRTLEVIKDPAFDASLLERDDLQLLGIAQEEFLTAWALKVKKEDRLAAVLNQSPLCNIGNYDPRFGDMDSNGWPKTGRDRALRCLLPALPLMVAGDIHYGTLAQLGIERWGDGPWSFSVPAFGSKQNRRWGPLVPAQGREIEGIAGSGNHHDRFGNKITVRGTAPGKQGYGLIIFDKPQKKVTIELHTMNSDRKPDQLKMPGWPLELHYGTNASGQRTVTETPYSD